MYVRVSWEWLAGSKWLQGRWWEGAGSVADFLKQQGFGTTFHWFLRYVKKMLNRLFIQLLEHECMMCHKHLKYLESLLLCSDLLVHFRFLTVHCLFTFGFTSVDVASLSLLLQCLDYYAFDSFPKTCTEHITFSFFLPPPRTLLFNTAHTHLYCKINQYWEGFKLYCDLQLQGNSVWQHTSYNN